MRVLVVGAWASLAECRACGVREELQLPVIGNFARKMWAEYCPAQLLSAFLANSGIAPERDPRAQFFKLERDSPDIAQIEFFEFAWANRAAFPGAWEALMAHGILGPMQFMLLQSLWRAGPLEAPLVLAPAVAGHLTGDDVVLSLSYDTLFEIGAVQSGRQVAFAPNAAPHGALLIAKPHGSFNLVVSKDLDRFRFGELAWPGNPQPADGATNFYGFVPPRQSKTYGEHWIARRILAGLEGLRPTS
jgi:hypothetical protein